MHALIFIAAFVAIEEDEDLAPLWVSGHVHCLNLPLMIADDGLPLGEGTLLGRDCRILRGQSSILRGQSNCVGFDL